jgi:hypothetical protein
MHSVRLSLSKPMCQDESTASIMNYFKLALLWKKASTSSAGQHIYGLVL